MVANSLQGTLGVGVPAEVSEGQDDDDFIYVLFTEEQ